MGEPKIATTYSDLYQSTSAGSDVNQLALIGEAQDGPMNQFLSFSGLSGLQQAEAIFGTGSSLPRAIREATMASAARGLPVTIHAMRIGDEDNDAAASTLEIVDGDGTAVMTLDYQYVGTAGNEWKVDFKEKWDDQTTQLLYTLELYRDDEEYTFDGTNCYELKESADEQNHPFVFGDVFDATDTLKCNDETFSGGESCTLSYSDVGNSLYVLEEKDYPNFLFLDLMAIAGENFDNAIDLISAHCKNQLSEYDIERFAFLEIPVFEVTESPGSSNYYVEVQEWVKAITGDGDDLNDRNLIVYAGSAEFADPDGTKYVASIAAACAASWLGLPVHRSMINQQVPNINKLVPEIPPSLRNVLVNYKMNYVRFQIGRGYVIGNSATAAGDGSDFVNAEVLRTVYTCGAEARKAGIPVWGQADDPVSHDGLVTLKAMMSKPLEARKGKTIVDYIIEPTIDEAGTVEAKMGVVTYQTMKIINHVVYVKRS